MTKPLYDSRKFPFECLANTTTFQILNFNHGLMPVVSTYEVERAAEFGMTHMQNYDLILLQEAWTLMKGNITELLLDKSISNSAKMMLSGFKRLLNSEILPDRVQPVRMAALQNEMNMIDGFHTDNGHGALLDSGLAVISRFPIEQYDFRVFKTCSGMDCNSSKGVLYTKIKYKKSRSLHVFNTHINAGGSKEQMDVVKSFVREKHVSGPIVLAGDFNTGSEELVEYMHEIAEELGNLFPK